MEGSAIISVETARGIGGTDIPVDMRFARAARDDQQLLKDSIAD